MDKTIKNWRWWVMLLTWYPIAFPFALIQLIGTGVGLALVWTGEKITQFFDWQYSNALQTIFRTKQVKRWVYRSGV